MKKILIIEDDQVVANIYRNKLSVEGYQVEVAADGEAGLSALRSCRPDVVVLDLMLPKISGVDLLKKVRAEAEFARLPIIVFSNTYLANLVQDAWNAGASKCLSKASCSPKQLVEIIRNTLSSNGAGAEPTAVAPGPAATPPTSMPGLESAAKSAPAGSPSRNGNGEVDADLRQAFIDSLPATLGKLRTRLKALIKSESETDRLKEVHELYRRVHALTSNAGLTNMLLIAQMADALEALLKELSEKPRNITPSTLRTVASVIDLLGTLFDRGISFERQELPPANILVVDDEAISRRAITYALHKAKLKCVSVEDPLIAYQLLRENTFDLIFLDVDMPGMNGFELCTKLRALPEQKKTPVVFVTGLNDFENRANSTMCGGNDLIAKPFLFIEMAVKALVYLMRARLEAVSSQGPVMDKPSVLPG